MWRLKTDEHWPAFDRLATQHRNDQSQTIVHRCATRRHSTSPMLSTLPLRVHPRATGSRRIVPQGAFHHYYWRLMDEFRPS